MKPYRVLFSPLITALTYFILIGFCVQSYANDKPQEQTYRVNDTEIVFDQAVVGLEESTEEVIILENSSSSLVVANIDENGFEIACEGEMPQRVEWTNIEGAELIEGDNYQRIAFDDFKLFSQNFDLANQDTRAMGCPTMWKKCNMWCKKKGYKGGYCTGEDKEKCACYGRK